MNDDGNFFLGWERYCSSAGRGMHGTTGTYLREAFSLVQGWPLHFPFPYRLMNMTGKVKWGKKKVELRSRGLCLSPSPPGSWAWKYIGKRSGQYVVLTPMVGFFSFLSVSSHRYGDEVHCWWVVPSSFPLSHHPFDCVPAHVVATVWI